MITTSLAKRRALAAACTMIGATIGVAAPTSYASPADHYMLNQYSACMSIPAPAKVGDLAVLNVIVTDALGDGYTSARPYDEEPSYERPENKRWSTGNFLGDLDDQKMRNVDPNMTIVKIGTVPDATDGGVCIDFFTEQVGVGKETANLVVDYVGYMPAGAGATGLDRPTRLTDTRTTATPVAVDTVHWAKALNAEPNDAVLVNSVVPWPKAPGYALLVGENDATNATAGTSRSTLNYDINTAPININANPNTGLAKVGTGLKIGLEPFNEAKEPVDVVMDQLATVDGESVLDIKPTRAYDTRKEGASAVTSGELACFALPGFNKGETAVVNLTVDTRDKYTGADSYGWIYIRQPDAPSAAEVNMSSANFEPFNDAVNIDPNTTMVTVGEGGKVCVDGFNGTKKPIYYIVDVLGGLKAGTFIDAHDAGGRKRLVDTRKGLKLPDLDPVRSGSITLKVTNGTNDNANKNGEWVSITNVLSGPIDMTGWTIQDASPTPKKYTFGTDSPFILGGGKTVNLYTGAGTDSATKLYWNFGGATAVWNNDGDTATLKGPVGNVVAVYTYP